VPVIDAHGHIGSWFEFPSPRSTCEGLAKASRQTLAGTCWELRLHGSQPPSPERLQPLPRRFLSVSRWPWGEKSGEHRRGTYLKLLRLFAQAMLKP
jgi:hypothetical protein